MSPALLENSVRPVFESSPVTLFPCICRFIPKLREPTRNNELTLQSETGNLGFQTCFASLVSFALLKYCEKKIRNRGCTDSFDSVFDCVSQALLCACAIVHVQCSALRVPPILVVLQKLTGSANVKDVIKKQRFWMFCTEHRYIKIKFISSRFKIKASCVACKGVRPNRHNQQYPAACMFRSNSNELYSAKTDYMSGISPCDVFTRVLNEHRCRLARKRPLYMPMF